MSKPVAFLWSDCHMATRVEVGSDSSSRRMIMLRKTAIALLAVASVGLAAPTMALARGGGGGGGGGPGGGGGGMGGGGVGGGHGGGVWRWLRWWRFPWRRLWRRRLPWRLPRWWHGIP